MTVLPMAVTVVSGSGHYSFLAVIIKKYQTSEHWDGPLNSMGHSTAF